MITDESILIIAEKLGISATHIYEVFVTAQPVLALLNILCGIIMIVFATSGYILVKKYIDEDDLPPVMGSIIGVFMGMVTILWLHSVLTLMLLPEYSAIRELMHLMI